MPYSIGVFYSMLSYSHLFSYSMSYAHMSYAPDMLLCSYAHMLICYNTYNILSSGTTAITLLQKGDKLFVANVGDSRAIMATMQVCVIVLLCYMSYVLYVVCLLVFYCQSPMPYSIGVFYSMSYVILFSPILLFDVICHMSHAERQTALLPSLLRPDSLQKGRAREAEESRSAHTDL
jgi:hypothetical protein